MNNLFSQNCESKYLSLSYRGSTFEKFSRAAFTPANELVSSGYLLDYNGVAHLSKLSKNGTPLWSNYYAIGFFTFYNPTFFSKARFNDFVLTGDGGMVVAGQVERYFDSRTRVYINQMALLAKIDKYGNVEWSRNYLLASGLGDLSFSNICKTTDGDYIVYMASDNGPAIEYYTHSFNRIIRFSADGQLKWATTLATGDYDAGGLGLLFKRGLKQLANKNIVVADAVYKSQRGGTDFKIYDARLHFSCLDYNTGKINWESNYPYTLPTSDTYFVPDIHNVDELPDGRLSFTTSLYLGTPLQPGLTKKPLTIITSNRGVAQSIVSYHSLTGNNYELVDVVPGINAGSREMLFRFGNSTVVSSAGNDAVINTSKGYDGIFPANCFAVGSRGYGILMSNYNSLRISLLLTDANGEADCVKTPAGILSETIPAVYDNPNIVITVPIINTSADYRSYFVDWGYPLKKKAGYPLAKTTDCEQPVECCKDFVDTFNIEEITICEGTSYELPGNNIVMDSGTYYIVYKTATGCDSITYYKVHTDKSLVPFTVGADTCLTGSASIVLHATEGYSAYNWMGISSASVYTVNSPGVYWVKVTNACGIKTDSIHIFDRCDFPVYLPSAFTPNSDNLNDLFGLPEQNKNRLIELKVFNRWGEVVFQTNQAGRKWDGRFKNQLLPTGLFAYYIIMEGLSGNRIVQKGTVLLIR